MSNLNLLRKGSKVEVSTEKVPEFTILGHVESVHQGYGGTAEITIRGKYVEGADRGFDAAISVEGVKLTRQTAAVPVSQLFQSSPDLSFPITVTKVSV